MRAFSLFFFIEFIFLSSIIIANDIPSEAGSEFSALSRKEKINDYMILQSPIHLQSEDRWIDEPFILRYSQLKQWKTVIANYSQTHHFTDSDHFIFQRHIFQYLQETEKFPTNTILGSKNQYQNMIDLNHTQSSSKPSSASWPSSTLSSLSILANYFHRDVPSPFSPPQSEEEVDPESLMIPDDNFYFYMNKKRQIRSYEIFAQQFPNLKSYLKQYSSFSIGKKKPSVLQDYLLIDQEEDREGNTKNKSPRIIVYQTRNAFTGGTTAMRVLYNSLKDLGYPAFLCNDTNYEAAICSKPRDYDIAITGEWCQEVIEEYLNPSFPSFNESNLSNNRKHRTFRGRGIQYYLGFHHARHFCRGWIPTSDSHYIGQSLGLRNVHAYFLGCPMSESILSKVDELISLVEINSTENLGWRESNDFIEIEKENLILLDYDFFQNYPTQFPFQLVLPITPTSSEDELFQVIFLKGDIPAEKIPYLLQRAKFVVDLAMPGPERISSEGVLFGAVPIISHRWNGASEVDFPSSHKIDLFDFELIPSTANDSTTLPVIQTKLSLLLTKLVHNYTNEVMDNPQLYKHYLYILSMPQRLSKTVDIFFGSSYLHVVLEARTLEEEYLSVFQILGFIYLYPMIAIDLFVVDSIWFMKHHYPFVDFLIQSGYLRYDLHDPRDYQDYGDTEKILHAVSYLQIHSLHDRERIKHFPDRPWKKLTMNVPIGYVPKESGALFHFAQSSAPVMDSQPNTVFLHVCELLSSRSNRNEEGIIEDVVHLPIWVLMKSFLYELIADPCG